jgi:Electron transfer DM13
MAFAAHKNLVAESGWYKETTMNERRLVKFSAAAVAMLGAIALMAQGGTIVATGTFHGAAHSTSGRATVYAGSKGPETLRLTRFKTSNGPNLHVLLIAASDAEDNEDFLKKGVERIDLGPLKGNEGDQNYDIPAGTDLDKYRAVSIFCERFNVNFGAAPLAK